MKIVHLYIMINNVFCTNKLRFIEKKKDNDKNLSVWLTVKKILITY